MRSSSAALRRRVGFLALVALLAAVSTTPRTAQSPASITIAWDANDDTTSGYRVHVGTESRIYEQTFDVGPDTSFVYAEGVPGTRYYFAVSAYDAHGSESPTSDEVTTVVGVEDEARVIFQGCPASAGGECQTTRVRADGLGPVRGLAALPDGRVLFVENARQVRVIEPGGLVATPSLGIDEGDAEFTELVVDPSFASTSFVFVGRTEPGQNGHQDFLVVRYRLVGDTLGQGAIIVGNLSFRGDHAPRFTVDDAGRIYVAMPRAADAGADLYGGRVLRFAADGSVPEDHPGSSPILAESLPVPLDLDWDGRAVWIVGLDERSHAAMGRVLLDAGDQEWPRRLSATSLESPPGLEVSALEMAGRQGVLIDTTQRLHRVLRFDLESVPQVEAMTWSANGLPLDVAIGPHGSIFLVVRMATGAFAVVEVTD
jgi:hypothetical protein